MDNIQSNKHPQRDLILSRHSLHGWVITTKFVKETGLFVVSIDVESVFSMSSIVIVSHQKRETARSIAIGKARAILYGVSVTIKQTQGDDTLYRSIITKRLKRNEAALERICNKPAYKHRIPAFMKWYSTTSPKIRYRIRLYKKLLEK